MMGLLFNRKALVKSRVECSLCRNKYELTELRPAEKNRTLHSDARLCPECYDEFHLCSCGSGEHRYMENFAHQNKSERCHVCWQTRCSTCFELVSVEDKRTYKYPVGRVSKCSNCTTE